MPRALGVNRLGADHPPVATHTGACRNPFHGCDCGGWERYAEARKAWVESGGEERWNRARALSFARCGVAQLVADRAPAGGWP